MLARLFSFAALAWAMPTAAQEAPALAAPVLSDPELATMTGKFIMPNGGSLALSVTSDTLLNGTLVLRTVLTVDQGSNLTVYGRTADAASADAQKAGMQAGAGTPALNNGVSVLFDRRTGTQIVMPTVNAIRGTTGSEQATPAELGIAPIVLTAGGPAVATPDGTVTLTRLPNGSQVTLAGDQIGIAHLVGQSVATAITNAGNDRTIDTVTTIGIDLHDSSALAMGAAAMKVDALVSDVARGMIR
ncbi:hypothetical protein [Sphingomonas sp. 1P08PE]|uniref:hypothetical protein n=1 Tax=Sphingomonas sp. 1P08PE TaxID=554122 RepID=UPI0039A31CA5